MSSRVFLSIAIAAATIIAVVAGVELAVRTNTVTRYLALQPANIVTEAAYRARMSALSRIDASRIVIIGDSVGLGQVMSDHGVAYWQAGELSSALSDGLNGAAVSNLSGNGLRAADFAQLIDDATQVGVDGIVLILSARAFSSDFNVPDQRHTHPWRGAAYSSPRLQARGAFDFVITDLTGAPLGGVLTQLRARYSPDTRNVADPVTALQFRQRLASATFDETVDYQAERLASALQLADTAGVKLVIVYATENPATRHQILPDALRNRNLERMSAYIARSVPNAPFLGPDPAMTEGFFVDHMHPNVEGYRAMALRLAPYFADQTLHAAVAPIGELDNPGSLTH